MKKVIWLLPVMALFLVGCAGNKVKPEAKVVIQKVNKKESIFQKNIKQITTTLITL